MAAPVNDLFANALEVVLSGGEYASGPIDNTEATSEPFEATLYAADWAAGLSCWWVYTPTADGTITADTSATTGETDTVLVVYSGTDSTDLVYVASSDDESGDGSVTTSRVTDLPVTAGTSYFLRVDAYSAGSFYRLHVSDGAPAPAQGIGRVRVGSGENHTVYSVPATPPHLASEPIRIMAQQFPHPTLNGRGQPT